VYPGSHDDHVLFYAYCVSHFVSSRKIGARLFTRIWPFRVFDGQPDSRPTHGSVSSVAATSDSLRGSISFSPAPCAANEGRGWSLGHVAIGRHQGAGQCPFHAQSQSHERQCSGAETAAWRKRSNALMRQAEILGDAQRGIPGYRQGEAWAVEHPR